MALFATPAFANTDVPPPRYDVGDLTEAELLQTISDMFGADGPIIYRVEMREARAACSKIWAYRWGTTYPVSSDQTVLGCFIQNDCRNIPYCKPSPVIVYTHDVDRPWIAAQTLRHEIGHYLGWSPYHER